MMVSFMGTQTETRAHHNSHTVGGKDSTCLHKRRMETCAQAAATATPTTTTTTAATTVSTDRTKTADTSTKTAAATTVKTATQQKP